MARRGWMWAGLIAIAGVQGVHARAPNEAASEPTPPAPPTSYASHHGSSVVVDGHGLLVAERNGGALVRADRNGESVATLHLGGLLGEVVTADDGVAFVADRAGDRLVRVDTRAPTALVESGSATIAEPFGLALSPDGGTVYATSVADHRLVAFDSRTLAQRWAVTLVAEPRGVAVSPDGTEATVGFLSSGALARVTLDDDRHRVRWVSLEPRDHVWVNSDPYAKARSGAWLVAPRSRFAVPTDEGRRHARSVFAVGYVGERTSVAPHAIASPQLTRLEDFRGRGEVYGGNTRVPPIQHALAKVGPPTGGQSFVSRTKLFEHQPRALAYHPGRDVLFVAGYGDDAIRAIEDVSVATSVSGLVYEREEGDACGIDGLAVDGDTLWAHCELRRALVRIETPGPGLEPEAWRQQATVKGPALVPSLRPPLVEKGAELFRRGETFELSALGSLACSSCHPEGRQDGLTWRLGDAILQTPMLAGRVHGTAPYKWSGSDATLRASFQRTIDRLGGKRLRPSQLEALEAYVTWLSTPTSPQHVDTAAVKRGAAVFADLDCDSCHVGDAMADGAQYPWKAWGLKQVDTPSLVGLSHTAPYFHDGSAVDLRALVRGRGSMHEMADMSGLTEDQARDLVAYLESL